MIDTLFKLSNAVRHNPEVDAWLSGEPDELYKIARYWFREMRLCGDLVNELIHDGCPVACVEDAAFAYVNVFKSHVNVGFFLGAWLEDPESLLEGTGKRMRHVKLKPNQTIKREALKSLIKQSYKLVYSKL